MTDQSNNHRQTIDQALSTVNSLNTQVTYLQRRLDDAQRQVIRLQSDVEQLNNRRFKDHNTIQQLQQQLARVLNEAPEMQGVPSVLVEPGTELQQPIRAHTDQAALLLAQQAFDYAMAYNRQSNPLPPDGLQAVFTIHLVYLLNQ